MQFIRIRYLSMSAKVTSEPFDENLRQPTDYSGFSTYWDQEEADDPANQIAKVTSEPFDENLRQPTDYSGFSTYWDQEEADDPANQIEIKAVYDKVKDPIEQAEGPIGGPRPAWSMPQSKLLVLVLFEDGYLEQNPIAPPLRCLDKNTANSVITQFSTLPLEQVHHFAYNGEYLNALFRDRKLVDILIHVEDRTFYGHRCILCAHSGYFSSILVESSVPPYAITDITLKSIDPEYFKKFLNFAYTGEIFDSLSAALINVGSVERKRPTPGVIEEAQNPHDHSNKYHVKVITLSSVETLRNLANKLKSKTLRAKIALFLSKAKTLTLDEALEILLFKTGDEDFLRPLAIETIIKNFKELLLEPSKLCQIGKEDLLYILQADNLNVDSELDAFWAVLYWVAVDIVDRAPALNRLMSAVRFTTMSSLELMDCARVSDMVRLSKKCQAYLINANWVCHVREVGLEDPLGLSKEQKRSCLTQAKPHEVCNNSV
ncbi:kelch-like protein 9 [Plakobranchus ocellatus]|uniref:Kelch-like protein 9 n=1 Tax=Plakobranchus ocellatus TaxID=259542 RepID=A0AAV3Z7K4_9GAST|nr:kelch-like protein 9 [Plakobranchus ocellatus]